MTAIQRSPADEIFRRGRDKFDRLYQEGADIPRVMAISIHPYLTGVPHRKSNISKRFMIISSATTAL